MAAAKGTPYVRASRATGSNASVLVSVCRGALAARRSGARHHDLCAGAPILGLPAALIAAAALRDPWSAGFPDALQVSLTQCAGAFGRLS